MNNEQGSSIKPIEERNVQFLKVTKHLYDATEVWGLIVPDFPDCVAVASQAGCDPPALQGLEAHRWARASASCRECVYKHHDSYMQPAYMEAVRTPLETANLAARKTGYVGHNGVFVLVSSQGNVLTAFRKGRRQSPQSPDPNPRFVERALRYLRNKRLEAAGVSVPRTNVSRGLAESMAADLAILCKVAADSSLPPEIDDERSFWLLGLLYKGQMIREPAPELEEALAGARHPAVISALRARAIFPNQEDLIQELRTNLADEEEPQGLLFDSVIDVEDTIAALMQSGESTKAERLAHRAAALLARFPARTVELGPAMQERLTAYQGTAAMAPLWWAIVQERAQEVVLGTALPDWLAQLRQLVVSLFEQPIVANALQPRLAAPRVEVAEGGHNWFAVYKEEDRILIHVLLPPGTRLSGQPQLWVLAGTRAHSHPVRIERVKPAELWLDIGTVEELTSLLEGERRSLGTASAESVHIEIDLEPDPNADAGTG